MTTQPAPARAVITPTTDLHDIPHLLTVRQAACFAQMSEDTITELAKRGAIKAVKAGMDWRIPRSEFLGSEPAPALAFAERRTANTVAAGLLKAREAVDLARAALDAAEAAFAAIDSAHEQYESRRTA